jgi:phosphoglycolate phosphatase-like HAD superfamily hydrolase
MCEWHSVTAVDGAKDALAFLSQTSQIFIATNAADSSENEIKLAFERVGLEKYISGYFCKSNLGLSKGTPEFYDSIIGRLGVEASIVTMVGDSILLRRVAMSLPYGQKLRLNKDYHA